VSAAGPPGEPRRIGYLYLAPGLVVFALFVLAPFAHSFWLSLFEWDGITPGTWAGLHNYGDVVSDPALRRAFLHALVLIFFYALLPVAIGLLLAGLLARARVRGLALFRTILFLPQVIAMVVVAVMWRMIYDPQNGALNEALRAVGLDNYGDVVSDPALRSAFAHALVLLFFYALLPVAIGLLLAGLLARVQVRGLAAFRTILFLPQVIALVVVAVMWRMIYDPQNGALNEGLRSVGLGSLAQSWLGDFDIALPAVGLVGTWVWYGLAMVLLTAGVQKIPPSLFDAARVDGAGMTREFLAVTLPALRGEIAVALTLTTIAALRNFDLVYITTKGGPGDATSVPAFQVYSRAFESGQVGSAAALGLSLTAVIFAISFSINRLAERGGR